MLRTRWHHGKQCARERRANGQHGGGSLKRNYCLAAGLAGDYQTLLGQQSASGHLAQAAHMNTTESVG